MNLTKQEQIQVQKLWIEHRELLVKVMQDLMMQQENDFGAVEDNQWAYAKKMIHYLSTKTAYMNLKEELMKYGGV